MEFEVLIDSTFLEILSAPEIFPIDNKYVLSLINGFEDGKWRYSKFQEFIWNNIAETSLSQRERESLEHQPLSLLRAAAQNLRLTDKDQDISKGSELAEIVLYGIMKHKYSALPVVPKIFYKQNSQDNAKGADSVHIVLEPNNDFSLWFGEAKFYNSIEDARLSSIIESVGKSLNTAKLKKENSIITNISDIDNLGIDNDLKFRIKTALSNRNSIDQLKPKINVPILLLHECDITNSEVIGNQAYKEKIIIYHKDRAISYFTKQIKSLAENIFLYSDIKFHIILFPVPQKAPIINKFVSHVEFHKDGEYGNI